MQAKKLSPSMFIGITNPNTISFGSGQPDLPPPTEVFNAIQNYKDFKYIPIQGLDKLREALAQENPGFTKENFIITNGASEALDLILRTICKPGDKVLLHKPYYYSYLPLLELNHIIPVFTQTKKGKIDIEDFKEKINGVKAVLINSPANPSGTIQEIETLKQIEQITKEKDIILISDEVYKDIIYERENYSLSGPKVITVNSFSKTFSMCGFRVGYLFSNDKKIVQKVIDLKTHTSMNTGILSQEMAYHALQAPKEYIKQQTKIWEERANLIYNEMKKMGLDVWKPEGAFYVFPKVKNPTKFVINMFEKYNVITYLGEWFGEPERVRFSYALDKEKISEGLARVKKYLESEGEL